VTSAWSRYSPVAGATVLIAAALIAIVLYARGSATPPRPSPSPSTTTTVVDTLTHLDLAQTAAVGSGGVANPLKPIKNGPPLTGPAGKPLVLYVGAEYCPYCAAERWSLVIALARFGTFSGLELTQSSSTDIYPNTPTLTFTKASFTSDTIEFQSVETSDREQKPLQQPTAAQESTFRAYDASGSIPFTDFANRQYAVGAGYLPDRLQGLDWEQVANQVKDPSSALGKQVLGNANWLTAAICQATSDGAGPACAQAPIKTLEGQLAG
jgi:hypothetical protein